MEFQKKISETKNKLIQFITIILILFQYLKFCQCVTPVVPCIYNSYTTSSPVRSQLNSLISNSSTDSWLIVYPTNTLPSGWSSPITASLPFSFTNTKSLSIKYSISSIGLYSIIIVLDSSVSSYNPYISFGYNTDVTFQDRQLIKNNNTFIFTQNYPATTTNTMIYLWGDINLKISSISVIQTTTQTKTFSIYVHPVDYAVVIATNISQSSISSSNQSITSTYRAFLTFNHSVGMDCMDSIGTPTNPTNYANYHGTQDYILMQTYFTYSIIGNTHPKMPSGYTNMLVIMISNISMGCTAKFSKMSIQGYIINDGYWNSITFNVANPVQIIYVEQNTTFTNQLLHAQFDMQTQLFTFVFRFYYFHNHWKLPAIQNFMNLCVDGYPVNMVNYSISNKQLNIVIQNTSVIYQNSTITFNNPGQYLRNSSNHFVDLNFGGHYPLTWINFLLNVYNYFNASYYIKQSILRIKFNITFLPKWQTQPLSTLLQLSINNGSKIPASNITLVITPDNYLTFDINMSTALMGNSTITASFQNGWVLTSSIDQQLMFQAPTYSTTFPTMIPSMFATDSSVTAAINQFANFTYNSLKFTKYFTQGVGFVGFNYLITNLISFQNLPFLYYFLQFKVVPNFYRKAISQILLLLQQKGGYQLIISAVLNMNFQLQDNTLFNNTDLLQQFTNGKNYNRLYDYGYSSDYVNNNGQSLLSLAIAIGKIIMVKLMIFIPILWFRRMLNFILYYWKQIILIEFVVMAPTVVPILTSHSNDIYYIGYESFLQIVNFVSYTLTIYICGISSFLLYTFAKSFSKMHIKEVQNNNIKANINTRKAINTMGNIVDEKVNHKNKTNVTNISNISADSKAKSKLARQQIFKFWFIENTIYFVIPFLVGFSYPSVFIIALTFITTFRFYFLIKVRKQLQCGQFLKQLLNKILWVAFNTVYLMYWIIQLTNIQCNSNGNQICFKIISILDLVQTFIFLGGCLSEIATFLIQIIVRTAILIKQQIQRCNKIKVQNQNQHNHSYSHSQISTKRKQRQKKCNFVLINNNNLSIKLNENKGNKKLQNNNKNNNSSINNVNSNANSKSVKNVNVGKNTTKVNKVTYSQSESDLKIQSHINLQQNKNSSNSGKITTQNMNKKTNIKTQKNVKINAPKTNKQLQIKKQFEDENPTNYNNKVSVQARSYKLLNQPFYKKL